MSNHHFRSHHRYGNPGFRLQ